MPTCECVRAFRREYRESGAGGKRKSEGLLPRTGDKRASILSSIDRIAVGFSTNRVIMGRAEVGGGWAAGAVPEGSQRGGVARCRYSVDGRAENSSIHPQRMVIYQTLSPASSSAALGGTGPVRRPKTGQIVLARPPLGGGIDPRRRCCCSSQQLPDAASRPAADRSERLELHRLGRPGS